eukprot:g21019.t1
MLVCSFRRGEHFCCLEILRCAPLGVRAVAPEMAEVAARNHFSLARAWRSWADVLLRRRQARLLDPFLGTDHGLLVRASWPDLAFPPADERAAGRGVACRKGFTAVVTPKAVLPLDQHETQTQLQLLRALWRSFAKWQQSETLHLQQLEASWARLTAAHVARRAAGVLQSWRRWLHCVQARRQVSAALALKVSSTGGRASHRAGPTRLVLHAWHCRVLQLRSARSARHQRKQACAILAARHQRHSLVLCFYILRMDALLSRVAKAQDRLAEVRKQQLRQERLWEETRRQRAARNLEEMR